MNRWILIAGGLVLYVLTIIATAPATLIDTALRRIDHGNLRLAEAQGTLWSGSGQFELRATDGRSGVAKFLSWRVLPVSLLSGHINVKVQIAHNTQPFIATIAMSGISLANADIEFPAIALGLGVRRLAPLRLTGNMMLHVTEFSFGRRWRQGQLTLLWRNAGTMLASTVPLGDYELSFESNGETEQVNLRTIKGSLQLDGNGSWRHGSDPDVLITAQVPDLLRPQLGPLLRLISTERTPGHFQLHAAQINPLH